MAEKFFWADALADRIIKERPQKEYVCASGITPSGQVHIGNFREVITTDMVVKALEAKGKKVRFIYSWDDFDRFRKVPKGVDSSYEQYLGMPISDFPSPFDTSKSYAEYHEKQFENALKALHIRPEFIYQHKMNKACKYAKLVRVALDKREVIMKILDKYRKEPLAKDWYPIMVYCSKCKKDTTTITGHEAYTITYSCSCGFEETFDYRKKGIVSIKWRVDWPLRWKYEGVTFEPGGIDHSVYGGSYTTAKEIVKEVFDFLPPIYQFYEWISLKGGAEFSSSTGNALSLEEVGAIYEPAVLRYLFVGTKPKSGFNISFDTDVIKNYEDFDRLEEKYFSGAANPKERRMYEVSVVKVPAKQPLRKSFRHLVTLVQIGSVLQKKDEERAVRVRNWLEKYAGDDMKFSVQERVSGAFTTKEKEALGLLREALLERTFSSDAALFDTFYGICERAGISNTEFFEAAYRAIIGKSKGPRLAGFILSIGQEKIAALLGTIKK